MTKDLEDTLNGLGPGYRAVVDRLVFASRRKCSAVELFAIDVWL